LGVGTHTLAATITSSLFKPFSFSTHVVPHTVPLKQQSFTGAKRVQGGTGFTACSAHVKLDCEKEVHLINSVLGVLISYDLTTHHCDFVGICEHGFRFREVHFGEQES
jgi:hypothetical protein